MGKKRLQLKVLPAYTPLALSSLIYPMAARKVCIIINNLVDFIRIDLAMFGCQKRQKFTALDERVRTPILDTYMPKRNTQ